MPTKKKAVAKPKPKAKVKASPKARKGDALECRVCGYRLVVDRACGCAHEHVYVCCGRPMTRSRKA
jgi:uncharacterized Zn-binding protein involved in type VI secretion